jgi:hypothetical protein
MEKYKSRSKFSETDDLPDTIEDVKAKFNIIQPTYVIGHQPGWNILIFKTTDTFLIIFIYLFLR